MKGRGLLAMALEASGLGAVTPIVNTVVGVRPTGPEHVLNDACSQLLVNDLLFPAVFKGSALTYPFVKVLMVHLNRLLFSGGSYS